MTDGLSPAQQASGKHRFETDKKYRDQLREKFDPEQVGHLPRVWCKDCREKGPKRACAQHREIACATCHNRMTNAHFDLAYVSHAQVVDRLNHVAPDWYYTVDRVLENSQGQVAGIVGTMYLGGSQRTEVGSVAAALPAGDAWKRAISDFIKRAAARFGVGIDLWMKEEAADYATDVGDGNEAEGDAIPQPRTRTPRSTPTPSPAAPVAAAQPEQAPAPAEPPKATRRRKAADPGSGAGGAGGADPAATPAAPGELPDADTSGPDPTDQLDTMGAPDPGPPAGAGDPATRTDKGQAELNERFDLLGKAVGKLGGSAGVWKEVNDRRDAGGAAWNVENLRDLQVWQLRELAGEPQTAPAADQD